MITSLWSFVDCHHIWRKCQSLWWRMTRITVDWIIICVNIYIQMNWIGHWEYIEWRGSKYFACINGNGSDTHTHTHLSVTFHGGFSYVGQTDDFSVCHSNHANFNHINQQSTNKLVIQPINEPISSIYHESVQCTPFDSR